MRKLGLLALVLFICACGKNMPMGAYPYSPYQPIQQAPMSPYGAPYGTPYGQPGMPFQPQLPQGYPQAYTPFLPMDSFFRGNPSFAAQWPQVWNAWTIYAQGAGYSPYDFPQFWFHYCPYAWSGPYAQAYQYLNQNFYWWATPTMQFAPQMNPQIFWAQYQGWGW